jgi:hypothetical protein
LAKEWFQSIHGPHHATGALPMKQANKVADEFSCEKQILGFKADCVRLGE